MEHFPCNCVGNPCQHRITRNFITCNRAGVIVVRDSIYGTCIPSVWQKRLEEIS